MLDNAFRHTPDGGEIGISALIRESKLGKELHASIKDSGAGIPSDDLAFIFERFYKADKARVRGETVGTGLGLSIVKNIVDSHQGTIQAESELGKGTIFHMILPVERHQ